MTMSPGKRVVGLLLAVGLLLLLFVAVYAPAFALIAGMRLTIDHAVPVLIALTLCISCVLILVFAQRSELPVSAFGVRGTTFRYLLWAATLGIPLSALSAWILAGTPDSNPLASLHLAPWLAFIYFGMAAPVQEEFIFRGLLQTTFALKLVNVVSSPRTADLISVVVVAVLFAAIHLKVGAVTALFALVLGLVSGELRRRSNSLLPAIVCHAIFNLPGLMASV